jgi:hypothetical protein
LLADLRKELVKMVRNFRGISRHCIINVEFFDAVRFSAFSKYFI